MSGRWLVVVLGFMGYVRHIVVVFSFVAMLVRWSLFWVYGPCQAHGRCFGFMSYVRQMVVALGLMGQISAFLGSIHHVRVMANVWYFLVGIQILNGPYFC